MDDNRNSAVLEGMYKGVAGKIDEVRQSVSRELQYSSTQQAYAYESLTEDYKRGVDTLLAELRYISQQNSSIYDYGQRDREDLKDTLLLAVREQTAEFVTKLTDDINARFEEVRKLVSESLDYDLIAERVTARLKAEEEAKAAAEAEAQAAAQAEAETAEEAAEEPVENTESAETPSKPDAEFSDEYFAYDVLAEKIATILPETDYDLIADKVVAALPQVDADTVADKVIAAIPPVDADAVADKVAETITPVDYDIIAERVVASFEGDATVKINEESVEKIARRVLELLGDASLPVKDDEQAVAAEPAPAPAPAPERKPKAVPIPVPVPAPSPAPAEGDTEMTTRYKRSFVAKIIESDEDIKKFYSDLKNVILSYGKVRSQINWTNDRFSLEQESLVKIGVRGKTLCVYLALDPNEFPETMYHQKFAGDTKMYEKTPMMVKIKSNAAVKRVTKLIELLMERNGAVKEARDPVDYAAQYFFRTEEELLAEGLIKTAVVEKSDLNF